MCKCSVGKTHDDIQASVVDSERTIVGASPKYQKSTWLRMILNDLTSVSNKRFYLQSNLQASFSMVIRSSTNFHR